MRHQLSELAEVALAEIATMHARGFPPELAVVRVSAIVENYVDELLDELSSRDLRSDTLFQAAVARIVQEKLHQNWPSRQEWLKDTFGISIDSTTEAQDFMLLVQLRNAMAHGAGSLTRLQRGKLTEQLELERQFRDRLSVNVDGFRVRPTENTARAAIEIGKLYVWRLDSVAAPAVQRQRLA